MSLRRLSSGLAVTAALVMLTASPAAADAPFTTPTGGGCQANGLAVAGVASAPFAFGQVVRTHAPIADDNALFFTLFCT